MGRRSCDGTGLLEAFRAGVANLEAHVDEVNGLNVFPVRMPALRERQEDIPVLAEHLTRRLLERHQRPVAALPRHAIESLMAHDWPGNVRELENVLERAIIAMTGPTLHLLDALAPEMGGGPSGAASTLMVDVERAHILRMLHASGWRIEGARGAALALGLKASTLRSRMRKLGVRRAPARSRTAPARPGYDEACSPGRSRRLADAWMPNPASTSSMTT